MTHTALLPQSRNPNWQNRVFFAQYDETAIWMDDLKPAFGEEEFFFDQEIAEMEAASLKGSGSSGQLFQREIDEPSVRCPPPPPLPEARAAC